MKVVKIDIHGNTITYMYIIPTFFEMSYNMEYTKKNYFL